MKMRNLFVLLLTAFAVSCTTDGDSLTENKTPIEGGGIEGPSEPTTPVHIKFNSNYIVAD